MAAAAHHYHFDIKMSCGGCSGAVDRVLKRMDGLTSYTVSLESQSADVYTEAVPFDAVLDKIKKTGKEVRAAENDGVDVAVGGVKVEGASGGGAGVGILGGA